MLTYGQDGTVALMSSLQLGHPAQDLHKIKQVNVLERKVE